MNVLITGGSGLVGQRLTTLLQEQKHTVSWFSRTGGHNNNVQEYLWDIDANYIDLEAFSKADAIIHLAGAGVADKRWTEARKKLILSSRTESTKLLYKGLEETKKSAIPIVSASAIGYYGFQISDTYKDESDIPGTDFLASVTQAWETEVDRFENLGHYVSKIRIGLVLSTKGGALKEMTAPPVLAPLGSGKQWMPWIHIDDLCNMFIFLAENKVQGVFNGAAPNQPKHNEFMQLVSKRASKPYLPIPVPEFILKMALGEMAYMLVRGTRVSTKKIESQGFEFAFTSLQRALNNLYQ